MWRRDVAGTEGVEPPLTEPESAVLPLDEVPISSLRLNARRYYTGRFLLAQGVLGTFFEKSSGHRIYLRKCPKNPPCAQAARTLAPRAQPPTRSCHRAASRSAARRRHPGAPNARSTRSVTILEPAHRHEAVGIEVIPVAAVLQPAGLAPLRLACSRRGPHEGAGDVTGRPPPWNPLLRSGASRRRSPRRHAPSVLGTSSS